MTKEQAQEKMIAEIKKSFSTLNFDEIKEIYEIVERHNYEYASDSERKQIYQLNQELLTATE